MEHSGSVRVGYKFCIITNFMTFLFLVTSKTNWFVTLRLCFLSPQCLIPLRDGQLFASGSEEICVWSKLGRLQHKYVRKPQSGGFFMKTYKLLKLFKPRNLQLLSLYILFSLCRLGLKNKLTAPTHLIRLPVDCGWWPGMLQNRILGAEQSLLSNQRFLKLFLFNYSN